MRTLSPSWRRVLVGSWIMIAVLTVGLVVLYTDNKRTRSCIANYMVADQRNTQARAELADEERQAFLGTLQVVFDPTKTPMQRKEAGDNYIQLVLDNNRERANKPILKVPTECD